MSAASSYEAYFGFVERPFSLTPDPKYFFKSRSHGRAIEMLMFGLRRRERFLLVTGDLGVGKTTLCRTLVEQLRRRTAVAYAATALLAPSDLLRLVLRDLGAVSEDEVHRGHPADAGTRGLYDQLVEYLARLKGTRDGAVLVIDEAHSAPPPLVDQLLGLATLESDSEKLLQIALVGQPAPGEHGNLGIPILDERVTTRLRLLPLGKDEIADYVAHRLTIAGGATSVTFTPRAIGVLFGLSGGLPRLLNLLCDRALADAAAAETHKIEPAHIEGAAKSLQLLRTKPKRFRWFDHRVS